MGNQNNVHCFSNFFITIAKKIMAFCVLKIKDYTGLRTPYEKPNFIFFRSLKDKEEFL